MSKSYEYDAVFIRQTDESPVIALFGASSQQIARWGGAPQKRLIEDGETTGFQRDLKEARVDSIGAFFNDAKNVLQNPILCAMRSGPGGEVTFDVDLDGLSGAATGTIAIQVDDTIEEQSLLKLIRLLRAELEKRVPSLTESTVDQTRMTELRAKASEDASAPDQSDSDQNEQLGADESDGEFSYEPLYDDESHLRDFWEELRIREVLLEELGEEAPIEQFIGYSRSDIIPYLKPALIVDGQHRLEGAQRSLALRLQSDDMTADQEKLVSAGVQPDDIQQALMKKFDRELPVSLLLDAAPEEHVFQFVVVNQKATPIHKSLLGTIVSTTLSREELATVRERLQRADIELEDSRAVATISRDPSSVFFRKVDRGIGGEGNNLLQANVLSGLIKVFRDLDGGNLYHKSGRPYAKIWRERHLASSLIVSDFAEKGFETPYEYWRSLGGPWRPVFYAFWHEIVEYFADEDDEEARNYWGDTKVSNLFNMVSLNILAADFFSSYENWTPKSRFDLSWSTNG